MVKRQILLFIFLWFSLCGITQTFENSNDLDTHDQDTAASFKTLTGEEIRNYVFKSEHHHFHHFLGGSISNINHETVDKVKIIIRTNGKIIDSVYTTNGLYRFELSDQNDGKVIDLSATHPEYHPLDTAFVWNPNDSLIYMFFLNPRLRILLRGRIYAGSLPVEDVGINIRHNKDVFQTKTMNCYTDNEKFWNCLYLGMFKQEIITDDPTDSIFILANKEGMKPLKVCMTFGEYKGNIMNLKLKYASRLARESYNEIGLQIGFPFTNNKHDWYMDFTYYRILNLTNFKRLAYGLDGNLIISTLTDRYKTFPGLGLASTDNTYLSFLLGPSFRIWLLNPDRRYFATYAGCNLAFDFNNEFKFKPQPFIGTRVMLDNNKALNLEIRYVSYNLDVVHYSFYAYGIPDKYTEKDKQFDELLTNIGLQILF